MIDAKKLYPNTYKNPWDGVWDYNPLIEAFGKVALRANIGSYQGDTFVLYDDGGKIGYLVFGYGSCTICDPIQSCDSYEELQELCNRLEGDVRWFKDRVEALDYFENYDWEGQWFFYEKETREFIAECIEYLKGE